MTRAKQIQWNTGRSYTEEGQVIRAAEYTDKRGRKGIAFYDFSRGVDGFIVGGTLERSAIMQAYDNYLSEPLGMGFLGIVEIVGNRE
jgi:hypothetical protein